MHISAFTSFELTRTLWWIEQNTEKTCHTVSRKCKQQHLSGANLITRLKLHNHQAVERYWFIFSYKLIFNIGSFLFSSALFVVLIEKKQNFALPRTRNIWSHAFFLSIRRKKYILNTIYGSSINDFNVLKTVFNIYGINTWKLNDTGRWTNSKKITTTTHRRGKKRTDYYELPEKNQCQTEWYRELETGTNKAKHVRMKSNWNTS